MPDRPDSVSATRPSLCAHPRSITSRISHSAAHVLLAMVILLSVAPMTAPADPAGTPLRMTAPAALPAARSEREAAERALVTATPASLAGLPALVAASKRIPAPEAAWFLSIARLILELLYPEALPADEVWSRALDKELPSRPPSPPTAFSPALEAMAAALPFFSPVHATYSPLALEAASTIESIKLASAFPGLVRGRVAELSGNLSGAAGSYRSVLTASPSAWSAALGLIRCLVLDNRFADAATAADALAPEIGDLPAFLRIRAIVCHENDRLPEAATWAGRALHASDSPPDSILQLIRAHYLADTGDEEDASAILSVLRGPVTSTSLYFELCARVEIAQGRFLEADAWMERGLVVHADDPVLLALRARILSSGRTARLEKAAEWARRALAILGLASPQSGSVGSTGSPASPAPGSEEAATPVTAISATTPAPAASSDPASVQDRSLSLLQEARLRYAAAEASRALLLATSAGGSWEEAIAVMDMSGQMAVDRVTQTAILRNSGRLDEALSLARTWLGEAPESLEALEACLRAYMAADRVADAAGMAAALDRNSLPPALRALVLCILGASAPTARQTLLLYREALFEQPGSADALIALATYYLAQGERERAAFYHTQALQCGTTETYLLRNLAAVAEALYLQPASAASPDSATPTKAPH